MGNHYEDYYDGLNFSQPPSQIDEIFERLNRLEHKMSLIETIRDTLIESGTTLIGKERLAELLEIEANYKDLCK